MQPPRRPLSRRFFQRDTVRVARELIGCTLWTERGGEAAAGRIVEVEAYLDRSDPASHAARGPTARSAIMHGPPAVLYVYLIYGLHHCLNIVTGPDGQAGAVLVRALEPLVGVAAMRRRRLAGAGGKAVAADELLCAGPGRLCQALGVDLGWNGLPLAGPRRTAGQHPDRGRVWVAAGRRPSRVEAGPRIGIRQARDRPLRFVDPHSPSLSRGPRPSGRPPAVAGPGHFDSGGGLI